MIKFIKRYRSESWALFLVMIGNMLINMLALPEGTVWLLRIIILIILIRKVDSKLVDKKAFYVIIVFMSWILLEIVRAMTYASGYWMWKSVINQLLLAVFYVTIIVSSNLKIIQGYLSLYWKFLLPIIIISSLYYESTTYYDYVPFSILMLFWSGLPRNRKWMLLGIMVFYFLTIGQRNDMIKIFLSSLLGLVTFYFIVPRWIIKLARIFFLSVPFILMFLAISGTFNVFKMDEYIKGDYTQKVKSDNGEVQDDNLKSDTRTFIYQNVFYTLKKYDAFLIGRSPAFGDEGVQDFWGTDESTGLVGRYGNEVGVMAILLWYGIVGVAIYFFIFIKASYLAIYRSNSKYAKIVGVYVSFLWMWSFIWEKPMFETFFMMDLVLIGLCFSRQFRQMSNLEIKVWLHGIFAPRSKKINSLKLRL